MAIHAAIPGRASACDPDLRELVLIARWKRRSGILAGRNVKTVAMQ